MKVRSFASLVLSVVVVAVMAGCSAAAADSPAPTTASSQTPAVSPTPTDSATPTPTETAAATLNGFDLAAVYAACDAAVPVSVWGGRDPVKPEPPTADAFGQASSDGYVKDHTNGDPNAIYVNVTYHYPEGPYVSALCVASGDPAAPTVTYIRTLD
ncbi:hypothetical protein G3T36_12795 [Diaminobutyricibacter tongyongensis]|uniref:Uncharacterized protein n=1 Tax=Leifsonia tongyongensis TaxID=1268043 RepID=A0A6L9Y0D1_9MICO|nr:hypothetical protein [Diaminobutyricibacter tongyongensis]NEN06744.1 hypothetical protein [Diaminobutyricibacter tongyongensis]